MQIRHKIFWITGNPGKQTVWLLAAGIRKTRSDLEEVMADCGGQVEYSTFNRRVPTSSPLIATAPRRQKALAD